MNKNIMIKTDSPEDMEMKMKWLRDNTDLTIWYFEHTRGKTRMEFTPSFVTDMGDGTAGSMKFNKNSTKSEHHEVFPCILYSHWYKGDYNKNGRNGKYWGGDGKCTIEIRTASLDNELYGLNRVNWGITERCPSDKFTILTSWEGFVDYLERKGKKNYALLQGQMV